MYTFITDETNTQARVDGGFFIYGGLVFSPEQMKQVTDDIEAIRLAYGFEATDKLKFDTRSRASHITKADYTAAKNDVIEACLNAGVEFISYMVLHKIATNEKVKGEWALNSVLVAFGEKFLRDKNDIGVVVTDRLPEQARAYDMLKRKFQVGLEIAPSGLEVRLRRVLLYAVTCDGASHLSSAVDIVLGALRWVVNQRKKPVSGDLTEKMFRRVATMMYHLETSDRKKLLREYGLILRPQRPNVPSYRREYDELVDYLRDLLTLKE